MGIGGERVAEGCPWAVLNPELGLYATGWVRGPSEERCERLLRAIERVEKEMGAVAIGIDSPRRPLPAPREHYWDEATLKWRRRRADEKGHGRHCEVVLNALLLARPQWTPTLEHSEPWMRIGFDLFECLNKREHVYEVFPKASYKLLDDDHDTWLTVSLAGWALGPAAMLDACAAALTVREFVMGRGCEIGGGDGLGSIVLPRVPRELYLVAKVLDWPG